VERRVDGRCPGSLCSTTGEPEKLTMNEKHKLVDLVVELVRRIGESLPEVQVIYLTMFPRFIDRCCKSMGHATKEDSLVMSGFRKALVCDIVEKLGVEVVEWYNLLGWEGEPGLEELTKKDVVCGDVLHLTNKANSFAAVSLCCRIAEVELFVKSAENTKKRKVD
jgi:hypothetical protein